MTQVAFRGVVEGFFSAPLPAWSWAERDLILDQMIRGRTLNTYVYCPKDDPYVTRNWARLYPQKQVRRFQKLTGRCAAHRITTFYGLNPQLDKAVYTPAETRTMLTAIQRKLDQAKSMGFDNILILFDDIAFAYNALQGIESREAEDYAITQANILNALLLQNKRLFKNIWFCSSEYFFRVENRYLKTLLDHLDPDIPLIWTGDSVFTRHVDADLAQNARQIVRNRRIVYWSNAPVNDPEIAGRYNLQSFRGVAASALNSLDGIVVNPMREAAANLPFLESFAAYCADPVGYDPDAAQTRALRANGAIQDETDEIFLNAVAHYNAMLETPTFFYDALREGRPIALPSRVVQNGKTPYLKAIRPAIADGLAFARIVQKDQISRATADRLIKIARLPVPLDPVYYDRCFILMMRRLALFLPQKAMLQAWLSSPRVTPSDMPSDLAPDLVRAVALYGDYKGQNKKALPHADKTKLRRALIALRRSETRALRRFLLRSGHKPSDVFFTVSQIRNVTQYHILTAEKSYLTKPD